MQVMQVALSVHLEISAEANAQKTLKAARAMLRSQYGVHESTVQVSVLSRSRQSPSHSRPSLQIETYRAGDDCNRCDLPQK